MTSTRTDRTLDDLRACVSGTVFTPNDPDYENARLIFSRHIDRRPAAVVRVADAADVAAAIEHARECGLEIAVRAGGHSGAGFGTIDDGLVIDVRGLDAIEIDVDGRTAWVGAGVTAGRYTHAVGAHGLATGFGDTGSVGVAGITVGGGVGFLSRRFGMTIDHLLAVELVTADGQILHVDADHHPDLFWAVRGGGGGFGVVTRLQFRLHEVPEIVGGMLMLPATAETIARFMELALAAPDELGVIVNVMPAPPMPFFAPEHHGRLVILALMAYAGGPADAEPVLAPFRAVATPLADLLAPMPYSGMFQPGDDSYHPIATSWTGYAQDIDLDDARLIVDTLTERMADPTVQMAAVQLRPLGGAISRVAADATAYAHRQWPVMLNTAAIVSGADALDDQKPWLETLGRSLADGTPGAYLGFVVDADGERIHDIYPGDTYLRLAAVKQAWDPDDVFHHNHTVAPAGA
ncbi:FAD-linked oxidase [Intrasporangium oryzae NRRL B-24470]|uniref:FAD-linked oxidase n=1 Tax=Intrasporangium oryzae NRRL B-24470 TaxID=1386089 RepID=W9GES8_9MICO|nr:FAD-dependent oxidoreductase [Intrasporangium oryzae]EWT03338.1 FAD-linked oxidase [Intrasporangium oryzae NRRL B-24470]